MKTRPVNGIELATADRGVGRPVLLVHGFPLDHAMWNAQIEALANCYRVVAPDLRGFGQSEVRDGKVTMAQMADDLAAFLDVLEISEPVVFCGLSMGGYVAWEFWRRHGQRLGALVLCDTRAAADVPVAVAGRLKNAEALLSDGTPALERLVDTMLPKLLAETTLQGRPELVQRVERMMLSTDPRGAAAALLGMAERFDATSILAEIDCPTLAIVGREDALSSPAEMGTIAAAIRGARLVEISNAGHLSPMENPADVNAALGGFLESL